MARNSECVEWIGPRNGPGYGMRYYMGRSRLVHRIAFFERHGYGPRCRKASATIEGGRETRNMKETENV